MGRAGFASALVGLVLAAGCGAGGRAERGTTVAGAGLEYGPEARFRRLEAAALPMAPAEVTGLPDVAERNVLFVLEAELDTPRRDPVLGGLPIEPPADWTVGADEEGDEVRVEWLEAEGGQVVVTCEPETELPELSTVTWIVRYERRNVRLTEAGTSQAIHVTPVAARVELEDHEPLYWISSEAPEPAPE